MKYLLILLYLVCYQVKGQTTSVPNISEEIEPAIEKLTQLLLKERTVINDFHLARASGPKIHIRDPYKEVSKTVHLSDFAGNPQLIEKVILKMILESYLETLAEQKSGSTIARERLENIIVLLQKTSNRVIDANPDTSIVTTYTVLYDHPLDLSAALKKGIDKGVWDEDILTLLK